MNAKFPVFFKPYCQLIMLAGWLFCCPAAIQTISAQKTPLIFKTQSGSKTLSTSANNVEYINQLEDDYTTNAPLNNTDAKLARNKLIYIGVEQIDTVFNNYRKDDRKWRDRLQFIFDFLEIGASTAINITKGTRPIAIISESLGLFQGARAAFTKDFRLAEKQILFNKMVELRSAKLGEIYENLNADVNVYPWEKARGELKNYLYAGTVDEALNALSLDTGAAAKQQQQNLATIKNNLGILGAPTVQQYNFVRAADKRLETRIENAYDDAGDAIDNADADIQNANRNIAALNKLIEKTGTDIQEAEAALTAENNKAPAERSQANTDAANKKKTDAQVLQAQANAQIVEENKTIASATQTKTDSATLRTEAFERYKEIYKAFKLDPVIALQISKLPARYPGLETVYQAAIDRIDAGTGSFDDYSNIVRGVVVKISDDIPKDATLIDRINNILTSVLK